MRRFIYGLIDPRTRLVRYVGLTTTGMKRPNAHRDTRELGKTNYKSAWIRQLLALNLNYEIVVLEESPADLKAAERFWIAYGRACAWPLTNLTIGGDGAIGFRHSAAAKAAISARHKGHPLSETHRKKISDAARGNKRFSGRKHTPETIQKMRAIAAGRAPTPEAVQKMAATLTGRKLTPEHRANIAAGNRRRHARRRATVC
jgi:hypothetical protein